MNRSSRPSRTTRIFLLVAVVAVVIAVAGTITAGRAENGHNAPEPGSVEAVAEELAKGQARDRAEINVGLAAAAEVAHEHLAQVLQELAPAVSMEEARSPSSVSVSDVDEWKRNMVAAVSALETVEEGTSEQTVAREAFIGAAQLLHSAATDYGRALTTSGEEREALAGIAVERRDAAVRLWQAGAAQLDTLTVESGEGHVHLFLAPDGDPDAVPTEFREPESGH